MGERLTLSPRTFYGWTMYPGYFDTPYLSPIEVRHIRPLGQRRFDLGFLNVLYAAGVQAMEYRLRTLRREESFMIAECVEGDRPSGRVVVIEPFSPSWCVRVESLAGAIDRLFDGNGLPKRDAVYQLLASSL